MPLTDAERAKRYREKKKQRDPSFIEKERKRQQMQRVPRGEMAPNYSRGAVRRALGCSSGDGPPGGVRFPAR